jgi:hypothetical protein
VSTPGDGSGSIVIYYFARSHSMNRILFYAFYPLHFFSGHPNREGVISPAERAAHPLRSYYLSNPEPIEEIFPARG